MHDLTDVRMAGIGVVSAITMELFGLPVQPIIWGLIGGFLGMGFAKPATFWRAAGTYVSASFISALIGSAVSSRWVDGSAIASNAIATVTAVGFHPLLALVIDRLPMIFDIFVARGGKKEQP